VLRLLTQTSAAAVAYASGASRGGTLLVYDFGAGRFDVAILRVGPGDAFEVLGSAGDACLGGDDIDARVQWWIAEQFRVKNKCECPADAASLQRLKEAAEEAKWHLTDHEDAPIELPFFGKDPEGTPLHLQTRLSRTTFEVLVRPALEKTFELSRQALLEANCTVEQVDQFALVGGSSRMPAVQRALSEWLGKKPLGGLDPSEAVARGAALFGNAVWNATSRSLRVHEATAHSLGIRLRGNRRAPIIPKNTRIPTSFTQNYRTTRDDQTHVDVVILQGESDVADENALVGQYRLDGVGPGPAGSVSIDITLAVDDNGIVQITAADKATGVAQAVRVLTTAKVVPQPQRPVPPPQAAPRQAVPAKPEAPPRTVVQAVAPVPPPPVRSAEREATPASELPDLTALAPQGRPQTPVRAEAQKRARSPNAAGFRMQLEELIAILDVVSMRALTSVSSSDYGRSLLADSAAAMKRARDVLETDDDAAWRESAFELARIQQAFATLLPSLAQSR
jgi:hypothetical protein